LKNDKEKKIANQLQRLVKKKQKKTFFQIVKFDGKKGKENPHAKA
jgi:hypothetical protein